MKKMYTLLSLFTLCTINHQIQADENHKPIFVPSFHAAMSNSPRYTEKNAEGDPYWLQAKKLYETYAVKNLEYSESPRIPKIIHQVWLGSPLPEKYLYFQSTWKKHHPDWEYKLWTEKEITEFGLTNQDAYDKSTNYGQKSDIARYEILYRIGGLYVDTDFECLKSFDILHHCFDFYTGNGFGAPFHVYMGLIGCSPGHKILKQCIDSINLDTVYHPNPALNILYATGPYLFTKSIKTLFKDSELGRSVIFPVNYFYPLPNLLDNVTYEETREWIRPETFAMHHWHVSWNNGMSPGKSIRKHRKL